MASTRTDQPGGNTGPGRSRISTITLLANITGQLGLLRTHFVKHTILLCSDRRSLVLLTDKRGSSECFPVKTVYLTLRDKQQLRWLEPVATGA